MLVQGLKKALPTNLAPKLVTNFVKPSLYNMHKIHSIVPYKPKIENNNQLTIPNNNQLTIPNNNQLTIPNKSVNKKYNYIVENLYKHNLIDAKKHPKELYKQNIGNEEKLNEYYELLKEYDKKIMVNEITVKELKDIFNNLIKNTKLKYKNISTNLLDNLSNNFKAVLKQIDEKIIRNYNVSLLFKLAERITNESHLYDYLIVLNNHFKRILLHNKNKFKKFIKNLKILFKFLKNKLDVIYVKYVLLNYYTYLNKLKLMDQHLYNLILDIISYICLLLIINMEFDRLNKKVNKLETKNDEQQKILNNIHERLVEIMKKNEELEQTNEKYKLMYNNTGGSRSISKNGSRNLKINEITEMHDINDKIFKILSNLDNYKKIINKEEKEKINEFTKVFIDSINNNYEKKMKYYISIEKKIEKNRTNGVLDELIKKIKYYILKNKKFNLSIELMLKDKKSNISTEKLNDYILYLEIMNTIIENI